MSNAVREPTGSLPVETPDPQFSLAVGLYVALLVVPVAVFAAARAGVSDPAALYGVFLVVGTGVTAAVTWAASTKEGVAERIGRSRTRFGLPVLGLVLAVVSFALIHRIGGAAVVGFFVGLLLAVVGFVLAILARSRYVKARLQTVEIEAAWTAGWPERAEKRLNAIAAVTMIVGFFSLAADLGAGMDSLWYVGQLLFPIGAVMFNYAKEREYTASPAGVEVRQTEFRQLYPWSAFDGYSRTDDAIVCHRPRRVDLRFAFEDLEDPEAVQDALGRYLGPPSPAFNPSSA